MLALRWLLASFFLLGVHVQAVPFTVTNGTASGTEPTPVVLWHGMGDTCCLPFSMGSIKRLLEDKIDGVYVRSLMIGKNEQKDQANGFFMPILDQLEFACDVIQKDPKLINGFHAIGFSQGGLFLRLLAQTCDTKMKTLISIGGPQQGVFGFPQCTEPAALCKEMDKLLELGAYNPLVQHHLVQAQYWHDPLSQKRYVAGNIVLPKLNADDGGTHDEYKQRLLALENLVLVKFENDTVVIPRESEWFGFYTEGQDKTVEALEDSALYSEDRLGLRTLDETGRLHLLQCEGNHLDMPKGFFSGTIIPFLTAASVPASVQGARSVAAVQGLKDDESGAVGRW